MIVRASAAVRSLGILAVALLAFPAPALPDEAAAGSPAADQAWCAAVCQGNAGCMAYCQRSKFRKITFTDQMAPIGTPVKVHVGTLMADGAKNGAFGHVRAIEDVVVNGELLITKGSQAAFVQVAGDLKQTGLAGTVCSPTVGISMVAVPTVAHPKGSSVSAELKPGMMTSNFVQRVPLSFANPTLPGSSAVAQIPIPGCYTMGADLVAYISGPPTAAVWTER